MARKMDVEQISIADFQRDCLVWLDRVTQQKRSMLIIKDGKPIAKLVPIDTEDFDIFGRMAGTAVITGDIISPIDDLEWTGDEENI
jgi:antitoxin (DNA-binding transcriptional repressor) of toxin-antitoxin stability system